MEEIEVGEYVRYNGGIHKIEQIGNTIFWVENGLAIEIEQNSFNQYKHSKNIIDLIEVGDYVNGDRVYKITSACIYLKGKAPENKHTPKVIETILTHEQYENNCYRLED